MSARPARCSQAWPAALPHGGSQERTRALPHGCAHSRSRQPQGRVRLLPALCPWAGWSGPPGADAPSSGQMQALPRPRGGGGGPHSAGEGRAGVGAEPPGSAAPWRLPAACWAGQPARQMPAAPYLLSKGSRAGPGVARTPGASAAGDAVSLGRPLSEGFQLQRVREGGGQLWAEARRQAQPGTAGVGAGGLEPEAVLGSAGVFPNLPAPPSRPGVIGGTPPW